MNSTGFMPRSVGLVRAWVRFYTAGLPPGLRDARREEIDADLWEHAHEAAMKLQDGPPLATHLLLRWLLGLPDDLLWRLAHIRTRDVNTKEGTMVQTRDYKTMTVVAGVIAAFVLGALIINTVIGEVEYQRQADVVFSVGQKAMALVYGPLGLAAIVGGFWFMRKAPMFCALLVTAGSMAIAILFFWLIVPELIAAGVSFYAIRRARRIQAGG